MAERRPYRVTKGNHGRWEDGKVENYRPGDTIYLTEAEARRLTSAAGSMVEPLWTADEPKAKAAPKPTPAPAPEPETPTEHTEEYGLVTLHWRQAVEFVESLETVEDVRDAKAEEESGKSRASVLKAADKRLAELEGAS